jgi:hypothetical protein
LLALRSEELVDLAPDVTIAVASFAVRALQQVAAFVIEKTARRIHENFASPNRSYR